MAAVSCERCAARDVGDAPRHARRRPAGPGEAVLVMACALSLWVNAAAGSVGCFDAGTGQSLHSSSEMSSATREYCVARLLCGNLRLRGGMPKASVSESV